MTISNQLENEDGISILLNPNKDILVKVIDYFNRNIADYNFKYLMRDKSFSYSCIDTWHQEQKDKSCLRVVAVKNNGDIVGASYLNVFHGNSSHSAKLGVTVDPFYHRKGIARKMCDILFSLAGSVNVNRIEALPVVRNKPAINFLESMGFVMEGTASNKYKNSNGYYYDCLYMAKLL